MPVVPRPQASAITPSSDAVGNPPGDSAADAYARAARDRAETTVALDATNQLQGLKFDLSNLDTGYRSLLGGDAVKGIDGQALTGHYLSLFDQGWKDISSKLMPRPKGMFDAAALNMRDDFAHDLVRHEAEQGRVWRQQVLSTTVTNATGALIARTDGNDAGYAAKARAALVANGLGQGLSGEDLDQQTKLAFGRRVVAPVVTARLSQGDVAGAKAFFDVHRDGMAGDDADILDRRLADAKRFADTRIAVDGVWNRLGPKSFNDPIDLNAIEDGLVAYHGGDEEARIRAHDEVLRRILSFIRARDEAHAGYVNLLIDQVKGGASPSQIATLPQFLALPKDKQRQLSDWHREQLADRLAGFAPDQNLDRMVRQFAAYHDLSGDDALKSMSDTRVQALEPVLGEDLTKQALKQKTGVPLDQTDLAVLARTLGLDPDPSDTLGKAQLGVVRSMANAAIASDEKVLTPQQKQDVMLDAAATAVQGHPLFRNQAVDARLAASEDGANQNDGDKTLGREPAAQVAGDYGWLGTDFRNLVPGKNDFATATDVAGNGWIGSVPLPTAAEKKVMKILADRAGNPFIRYDDKLGTLVYVGLDGRKPLSPSGIQAFKENALGEISYVAGVKSQKERDLEDEVDKSEPASDPAPQTGIGPNHYQPQPGDQLLLARMIFAESSNIPEDAAAIGWSIMNRAGNREFGHTLTDVLRDRNGFQIVPEGGGPAGGSVQWRATADPSKLAGADAASWAVAQKVAAGIMDGSISDPTDGATFFFSANGFDGTYNHAPGGFKSMLKRGTIQQSVYQSQSTHGRSNYFFKENKNK